MNEWIGKQFKENKISQSYWLHFLFWFVYLIFELGLFFIVYDLLGVPYAFDKPFITFFLLRFALLFFLFYIPIALSYKYFLAQKKIFIYLILCVAMVWVSSIFHIYIYKYSQLAGYSSIELRHAIPGYTLFIAMVTFFKLAKDFYIHLQKEKMEKQHRIEQELIFLKAQVSPHFLFNTMNNLYGLAVVKSDNLPHLMLKLSNLLRYSLYDTNQKYVGLEKEINYIKNYVELERIRMKANAQIHLDFQEDNIQDIFIAPIILITFVENVFKHSKSLIDKPIVAHISLKLENEQIVFRCANNFLPKATKENKGIGLENVRKRLNYLYADEHHLSITTENECFEVLLHLKIKRK